MPLKQVKFTVDFVVSVEDITDEDIRESPDFIDQEYLEKGRRERRLLHALLENKEAFKNYINYSFISLMQYGVERVLDEKYPIDGSYEAIIDRLKPVVESLSKEDRELIEKDMENGTFGDDALFFSAFNFALRPQPMIIIELKWSFIHRFIVHTMRKFMPLLRITWKQRNHPLPAEAFKKQNRFLTLHREGRS